MNTTSATGIKLPSLSDVALAIFVNGHSNYGEYIISANWDKGTRLVVGPGLCGEFNSVEEAVAAIREKMG